MGGHERNIWLHRHAVLTACATFLLIIAGGLVTSTDSGLAVPDWPLSYGQFMPPMVGGIFYEHGHRMVATFVGFLTTILAIWIWRKEERRWVRTLGWVALIAVIVQGVLGGLTVLYLLPTPISVSHATLAQSFFSLTVFLALVTSPAWKRHTRIDLPAIGGMHVLMFASTLAVFIQLILGAVMRHMNAGLAIPDFPLAYGRLVPQVDSSVLQSINDYRQHLDLPAVDMVQIWIHFAHRVWACVVVALLFMCVRSIVRDFRSDQRLMEPAIIIVLLLAFQISLGALTVWTGKAVEVATAHVATGALLLAMCVVLSARMYALYSVPVRVANLALEGGKA